MNHPAKKNNILIRITASVIVLHMMLFLCMTRVEACGDFRVPETHFEGVSEKGSVSHWEQLGSLDLGEIKLPLIIGFQTYLPYSSPELGAGWTLPLFDSNIVQRDEGTFDMVQPDGSWGLFRRDTTNPNILHGSGGMLAEINGDIITVNSTCGSGWKMIFDHGKITSLSKGNHTLSITRDPMGRATDLMDGPTRVLALEQDQVTGLTKSITMGDKKYELSYDAKPRVARVNGVNLVGGVDQSLHKITFPTQDGGKSETFDFAVTEKLLPNLKITDAQGKERMIVWGTDGKILQDGEWVYTIKPQADPEARYASIERKNADSKSELWNRDESKGEEVAQGIDGVKKIKTWFTGGVLAGRQRKEELIVNGKSQIIRQCSYDEKGHLIREAKDGMLKVFRYGKLGNIIDGTIDDAVKNEKLLLEAISFEKDEYDLDALRFKLGSLYTHEFENPEKAREVANHIMNPQLRFSLILQSYDHDPNLSPSQKITHYSELLSEYPDQRKTIDELFAIRSNEK